MLMHVRGSTPFFLWNHKYINRQIGELVNQLDIAVAEYISFVDAVIPVVQYIVDGIVMIIIFPDLIL